MTKKSKRIINNNLSYDVIFYIFSYLTCQDCKLISKTIAFNCKCNCKFHIRRLNDEFKFRINHHLVNYFLCDYRKGKKEIIYCKNVNTFYPDAIVKFNSTGKVKCYYRENYQYNGYKMIT